MTLLRMITNQYHLMRDMGAPENLNPIAQIFIVYFTYFFLYFSTSTMHDLDSLRSDQFLHLTLIPQPNNPGTRRLNLPIPPPDDSQNFSLPNFPPSPNLQTWEHNSNKDDFSAIALPILATKTYQNSAVNDTPNNAVQQDQNASLSNLKLTMQLNSALKNTAK